MSTSQKSCSRNRPSGGRRSSMREIFSTDIAPAPPGLAGSIGLELGLADGAAGAFALEHLLDEGAQKTDVVRVRLDEPALGLGQDRELQGDDGAHRAVGIHLE